MSESICFEAPTLDGLDPNDLVNLHRLLGNRLRIRSEFPSQEAGGAVLPKAQHQSPGRYRSRRAEMQDCPAPQEAEALLQQDRVLRGIFLHRVAWSGLAGMEIDGEEGRLGKASRRIEGNVLFLKRKRQPQLRGGYPQCLSQAFDGEQSRADFARLDATDMPSGNSALATIGQFLDRETQAAAPLSQQSAYPMGDFQIALQDIWIPLDVDGMHFFKDLASDMPLSDFIFFIIFQ